MGNFATEPTQAAYAFLKRLVKQFDEPKVVVTDKSPSITSAFKKLKEYGFYQGTEHRTKIGRAHV